MKELVGHILLITVVSAVFGAGLGGIIYAGFIYKGSEIRIFVVRKRTNIYQMYSRQHGSYNTEHYVVYAKYPDSDKIHTLACDGYIYRRLHENKGYNVTVRFLWIKKIHREKLRSKKEKIKIYRKYSAERSIQMRESILTIPISEILDPKEGCPICRMRDMLEQRTVEYIMGAAMMEPDVRIETNRAGFCHTHFQQMLKQKNRLSLALMLQTHLEEVDRQLFSRKKLFEPKNARKAKLSEINETCFVCEKVDWGMERLMRTFFEMYGQKDFRTLLSEQEFVCLPHYDLLLSLAPAYLQKAELESFNKLVGGLTEKYIASLYEDVSHYCSMYDYRNTGKDADWGNSRDSIERAIKFLVSRE